MLGVTPKRLSDWVRVNLNYVNLNYVNLSYVNLGFLIGTLQFEKMQFEMLQFEKMQSFAMTAPAVASSQSVLSLMNELLDSESAFERSWSIPDR